MSLTQFRSLKTNDLNLFKAIKTLNSWVNVSEATTDKCARRA